MTEQWRSERRRVLCCGGVSFLEERVWRATTAVVAGGGDGGEHFLHATGGVGVGCASFFERKTDILAAAGYAGPVEEGVCGVGMKLIRCLGEGGVTFWGFSGHGGS